MNALFLLTLLVVGNPAPLLPQLGRIKKRGKGYTKPIGPHRTKRWGWVAHG